MRRAPDRPHSRRVAAAVPEFPAGGPRLAATPGTGESPHGSCSRHEGKHPRTGREKQPRTGREKQPPSAGGG